MKGYQVALAVVLVLVVALSTGLAGYSIGRTQAREFKSWRAHMGLRGGDSPASLSRVERLEKFREMCRENPEQSHKMMRQRRAHLRQRLAQLKEKDPEKYRELIQKQINRLEVTLEKLREELPEPTTK